MASGITPLELHLHPLPTPQEEIQEEGSSPSSSAPSAGASTFLPRSHSPTPRHQLHGSPRSFGSGHSSPFSLLGSSRLSHPPLGSESSWRSLVLRWWSQTREPREKQRLWLNRRKGWQRRRARGVAAWIAVVGFFFLMNWRMFSRLQESSDVSEDLLGFSNSSARIVNNWSNNDKGKKPGKVMLTRLLAVAAHALAEREKRPEPPDLWKETLISSSSWTPCANQRNWRTSEGSNGYLLISANGGINQRVMINAPNSFPEFGARMTWLPDLQSRGFTQHRSSTDLDLDALNTFFARVGFPRRDLTRIRRALDHSSSLLWLSHSKPGEPVAFARATGVGVFNAVVWDVVVDPSFQGIGLGRAVMERIVADLRGMGIVNIALYAEPRVIGFYRPLGFAADPDGIKDGSEVLEEPEVRHEAQQKEASGSEAE